MTGVWEDRSETQGWCQNYSKSCVTGGSWDWDGEFFQTSAGTATTAGAPAPCAETPDHAHDFDSQVNSTLS